MKKIAIILSAMLVISSCSTSKQMNPHPSVKSCGKKSHRESQSYLSGQFGGANYNKPNRPKMPKHF